MNTIEEILKKLTDLFTIEIHTGNLADVRLSLRSAEDSDGEPYDVLKVEMGTFMEPLHLSDKEAQSEFGMSSGELLDTLRDFGAVER